MYMVLMELIKTNEELVDVCKSISEEKFITIDTEFIREKTYWSKLCLIQICTHNKAVSYTHLTLPTNREV